MDPRSKVDFSRIIWEASMVMEKHPEVDPPYVRVPGRGLLVLPILDARRQRSRGEIAKKGSVLRVSATGDIYKRRGQPGGQQGSKRPAGAAPLLAAPGGRLGH